ncbi:MAG: hypothetical protein ACTSVI_14430 [Promethearchaeota archaeon]
MSEIFSLKKCDNCGELFSLPELKKHDDKLYCKKCFKSLGFGKREKREKLKEHSTRKARNSSLEERISIKESIPLSSLTSIIDNLSSKIEKVVDTLLSRPVRIELNPLEINIVGKGSPASKSMLDRGQEKIVEIFERRAGQSSEDMHEEAELEAHLGNLDEKILRIMGFKKKKWRVKEITFELKNLYPKNDFNEKQVQEILEKLSHANEHLPDDKKVVQLSSRYIRADFFNLFEEIDFLDLQILHVLSFFPDKGLPATLIHKVIMMENFSPCSLSTLLNHLRVLKTSGWNLLKKKTGNIRENYKISRTGSNLFNKFRFITRDIMNATEIELNQCKRLGLINDENELTNNARIFNDSPLKIIKMQAKSPFLDILESIQNSEIPTKENEKYKSEIRALQELVKVEE